MPTVVEGDFEWDSAKAESNLEKHGIISARTATATERTVYGSGGWK
jgi:uncharacterized DUF497 family protein